METKDGAGKNEFAKRLSELRWAGKTKEEKRAHMSMMGQKSSKKRWAKKIEVSVS